MISDEAALNPHFSFEHDTLAFANELYWEYRIDPKTRAIKTQRSPTAPTYAHRCFVMVRSARQFFYHARFNPHEPVVDDWMYQKFIRQVVNRNPRVWSPVVDRICIPGYPNLREFSRAKESLLKAHCGAAWESYCLRSHWRMVFPISRAHQARTAIRLVQKLKSKPDAIVHLVQFPQLTINHGILLYHFNETSSGIEFSAYDPNQPGGPTRLEFDWSRRTFSFPKNHYWAGGQLNVIEIYRSWFF